MKRQTMPPLGQPPLQLLRRRLLLRRPAAARHVGTRPPAGSRRQPAAVPALQGKSLLDRRLGQTFGQERLRPRAWKDTLSTLSCTLGRTLRLPAGEPWTAAAPTRVRLELQRNGLSGSAAALIPAAAAACTQMMLRRRQRRLQ